MNDTQTTSSSHSAGDYVQLMIGFQSRLYAFILSLVANPDHASDVLQETNVVLWEKMGNFEMGTNFQAWAFKIARFQVMAHRQKLGRDRHVFDDETLDYVAAEFDEQSEGFEERMSALTLCLEELSDDGRELIKKRYKEGMSVKGLAEKLGHTANRVAVTLHRLRSTLMECIERPRQEGEPA